MRHHREHTPTELHLLQAIQSKSPRTAHELAQLTTPAAHICEVGPRLTRRSLITREYTSQLATVPAPNQKQEVIG